jgi:hypothetical protein
VEAVNWSVSSCRFKKIPSARWSTQGVAKHRLVRTNQAGNVLLLHMIFENCDLLKKSQ